jgi:WXG100 family type VII secretion target
VPTDAYAVSPTHLLSTSSRLRGSAASIAGELSTCTGEVRGLDAVWTGASHAQYAALYQEWQTSAARLQRALEGIAAMTGRAAQVYAGGDHDVAAMIGRM